MSKQHDRESKRGAAPTVHHQGRYLGLYEVNGWEYVTRTNASGVVAIVAVTEDEAIVLVEQFRAPIGRRTIELPAGLAGDQGDPGEALAEAAKRELWEETGYCTPAFRYLTQCPSSAGMSDEELTFFLAERCVREGPGGGDASEDITVHTVPLSEIDGWLAAAQAAGKALDPKIYAGLYWLHRREALDLLFPDGKRIEASPEASSPAQALSEASSPAQASSKAGRPNNNEE